MPSWSLQFVRRQIGRMSLPSIARYRRFQVRARAGQTRPGDLLQLNMKYPIRGPLWLREAGSDDVTYDEVMVTEVYKPVVERLPDCRWVVDLGANIGLTSRYLLARYPAARLLAVEPNESSHAVLVRNLAAVASDRATAVRAAIWGQSGRVSVSVPSADMRFDCVRVSDVSAAADGSDQVQAYTVPELCKKYGFPAVDLLKVDIEGAEVQLLSGDTSWLSTVNAIAIEFHDDSRAASRFDELMAQYGFSVLDGLPHTVVAVRSGSGK
jgi:FkbM family methyltransferase